MSKEFKDVKKRRLFSSKTHVLIVFRIRYKENINQQWDNIYHIFSFGLIVDLNDVNPLTIEFYTWSHILLT